MSASQHLHYSKLNVSFLTLIASRLAPLRCLQVANNPHLTDQEMAQVLPHCEKLEQVDLQNCAQIGDGTLHSLTRKVSLRALRWIGNLATTADGYAHLAQNSHNLRSVNLSGSLYFFSDTALRLLTCATALDSLDLSFCPLEDDAFSCIHPSLAFLNLQGCSAITDRTLYQLAKFPSLQHIFLAFNDKITVEGLRALSHLKTLKVYACANVA